MITLAIIVSALGGWCIGFLASLRWAQRKARLDVLKAIMGP